MHVQLQCRLIAALLQYSLLTTFMWMLAEAVHFHCIIVTVYFTPIDQTKVYAAICYGETFLKLRTETSEDACSVGSDHRLDYLMNWVLHRDETITPITRDLLVISMIATRYAVIEYALPVHVMYLCIVLVLRS